MHSVKQTHSKGSQSPNTRERKCKNDEQEERRNRSKTPDMKRPGKKKKRRSSRSSSCSPQRKKKKRARSPSSSSSEIERKHKKNRSPSSSSSERERKHKKKKKKDKKKKKHKKHKKLKSDKDNKELKSDIPVGPNPEPPAGGMAKARSMVPMTKEEWEKQQSVVRRVYDPETGRNRLVKGDGEIIEEIVSKERQKEINKQATQGDGLMYASRMGINR